MYLHHNDDYQLKKEDMAELENEYNLDSPEGRKRVKEYNALEKKVFTSFKESEERIIVEQANFGHVYAPI